MKNSFRQSMAWLHTWTGLVVGWVLFFVFVTGTAGYVDDEITRWMKPELPLQQQFSQADTDTLVAKSMARLETVAPGAKSWTITLPHMSLNPREMKGLSVAWEDMPQHGQNFGRRGNENLDIVTGKPVPAIETRATYGGTALYEMHYLLHYVPANTAIMVVGICTMLMLLAVISGVITHKKIITDFFTFRPGKGQRSWLDAHNVVGVMCLPFFLMITYTGLVFFTIDYMPLARNTIYGTTPAEKQTFWNELLFREQRLYQPVTRSAWSVPDLVQRTETAWGNRPVETIHFEHRAGGVAFIELRRTPENAIRTTDPLVLRYSAVDGSILPGDHQGGATQATRFILLGLHEGLFANWWLRWLYFVSGLMGCAVIATGLVLWTVKRRAKHAKPGAGEAGLDVFGLCLVEILNAATIAGLPMAIAAFFLANRLLPLDMAARADWEFHTLFITWGWTLLYASLRPLKKAWIELLAMSAAAFLAIPVINTLTTDKHLGTTLRHGDMVLAGFDLTMLALGAAFAFIVIRVARKWRVAAGLPAGNRNGVQEARS